MCKDEEVIGQRYEMMRYCRDHDTIEGCILWRLERIDLDSHMASDLGR